MDLERQVRRLEGEQLVDRCAKREGELAVMRGEVRRAKRRLDSQSIAKWCHRFNTE